MKPKFYIVQYYHKCGDDLFLVQCDHQPDMKEILKYCGIKNFTPFHPNRIEVTPHKIIKIP